MENDKNPPPESVAVRRQDEDRMQEKEGRTPDSCSLEETQRLYHELQVHLEEMEMRNGELRQAKAEADNRLERCIDLYDFAPVAYVILDRKGTIQAVNFAGAALLGEDRSRLIGRPFEFFLPKDQPHFTEFLDKAFASRSRQSREATIKPVASAPLYVRIEGQVSSSGDECRLAILDLSEARYRTLFHESPTMIFTLDPGLTIRSANPFAASQLGYTTDELEGLPLLKLLHDDDRPAVVEQLQKCLHEPKKVYRWQFRKKRKDGKLLWVEETAQTVYDLNGALSVLIVCQDVTDRKHAEEEREHLLLQLEAVLENINEGVIISDLEAKVIKMNREALAMHGYENEVPARRPLSEYQDTFELTDLDGRLVPFEQWPMSRALRGERFTDYEVRVLRKDTGKSLIGSYSGTPVPNQSSDIILCVVTMRDITERKRVEEAFRESEARFHAIFDLAAVGIAQVSLNGRWLLMNRKLSDLIGYSFDELANMTLQQVTHPDDIEPHLVQVRRLFAGEIPDYTFEKRLLCKDGSILWINLNATLVRDQNGEPEYAIAIIEDINERKNAEEALLQSEERFRLLADTAPVIIWETGPDGRCTFLNRSWFEFTGRNGGEELGDGWMQGVHPDDRERCRNTYLSAFSERQSFAMEYRLCRSDGEYGWIAATGVPRLAPNGELLGYIGTCFDITERKRVKEELQQDKELLEKRVAERTVELDTTIKRLHDEISERIRTALALRAEITERLNVQAELREKELLLLHQSRLAAMGEMIGNIAHQWRQPLNLLGLLVQDLSMTYRTGVFGAEYLDASVKKMLATTHHMSQTIDDFRFFFRPDKEKVDFRPLEMVEKTLSLMEGSLKAEQITTAVVPAGDPVVSGYPTEFCQVILNIIINARDAFAANEVPNPTITIEIGTEEGRCVVTIADNAGGISEHNLDKIFDPYFTTKGPDKGTGVGLFMSKMIIEKNMGGTLSARNMGNGAQFRIEI